ncbi:MAG: putative DNA binding domain-containing protein, partial [Deltaproteobacteria bacterium]|nr:putative DNA binding domain-containing protein [Deltaproteobacteria bacterium]
AYILYLMGRTEYGLEEHRLRALIAQWFFMTALTGRYTSSTETMMEFDLARFRGLTDAVSFATVLEDICRGTLTSDYWSINLPQALATAAAWSPSMFAFFSALNLHDARVLFSELKASELMDPSTKGPRTSLERHHLFPKAYLKSIGITEPRDTNQLANFTMVEWGDNSKIGDKPPAEYLPEIKTRFSGDELERMYYWHALPDNWENLEYPYFLQQRRELMARVIRDAYLKLAGDVVTDAVKTPPLSVEELVNQGETKTIEFKASLRVNLHTREKDPRMELSVLKTIAAFLNSGGGTLIIGVKDDGEPVGIKNDNFPDEDKMNVHLDNLLKDRIGAHYEMYIERRFDDYQGVRVMVVECRP